MKAVVVGCGKVGGATAHLLTYSGLFDEVCLIDKDKKREKGEVLDLRQSLPCVDVKFGCFEDVNDCDVLYVTAGFPRGAGESRVDLLERNSEVVRDIMGEIDEYYCDDTMIVVATNPVNDMVRLFLKDRDTEKVLGIGSAVDTYRLKSILARRHCVKWSDVETYVLGDHGENMVPVESRTRVKGKKVCVRADDFKYLKSMGGLLNSLKGGCCYTVAKAIYDASVLLVRGDNVFLDDLGFVGNVFVDDRYGLSNCVTGVPVLLKDNRVEGVYELFLSSSELDALRKNTH